MSKQTVETQIQSDLIAAFQNSAWLEKMASAEGLTLISLLIIWGFFSCLHHGARGAKATRGKLASGRFGGHQELAQAKREALAQIKKHGKKPVATWIGEPTTNPFASGPIYFPDANRSTLVLGAPNAGKTYSAINPLAMSAIDQDFPLVVYDFKYPEQTKMLATYAKAKGYHVHILAPGYAESGVLNPITEFLDSALSGLSASQLAEVMNANFKKQGVAQSEDGYFGPAGDQLVKATLLLARTLAYPDLITCSKILSVDRLASRILGKRSEMNQWIVEAFSQFTSAAGSEKTVMSIQSTAQLIFNRLQIPEVLSVLCGQSTIPTQLTGKTMLVLGLAQEKRNVLAPLLAAIINLLVNRNMARPRQEPLFVILDELSTLYLPYLKNWPNEHRSQGLCLIVGVQNKTQLEGIYGQVDARTIMGAFGTRIYFNPQDIETANWIAKSLPEKEVVLKSRNRSVSGGKVTHTYSEDVRTKPLMSGARINQMKTGEAILINPHFASPQWGFIPIHRQIVLSRRYQRLNNWCESTWSNYLEAALIKAAGKRPAITEQDLILRQKAVEQLFPDSLVKKTNDNIPDLLSRLL